MWPKMLFVFRDRVWDDRMTGVSEKRVKRNPRPFSICILHNRPIVRVSVYPWVLLVYLRPLINDEKLHLFPPLPSLPG